MLQLAWLVGPLVGGVIGYVTNDIAVRMMFRPHTEKRLCGKRVPFTPGLIPKGRPRLAHAIRDVLDQDLLSAEVIETALLSEPVLWRIDAAVQRALEAILSEERTPRMLLSGMVGEATLGDWEEKAKRVAGQFLMEKLMESGIEQTAASVAVESAREKAAKSTAGIANLFFDDKRSAQLEASLAGTIREKLSEHGPAMLDGLIEGALHDWLDVPLRELVGAGEAHREKARAFLLKQYQNLVRSGVKSALGALELGAAVEAKLNALAMSELEALIMRVMKKELRAIVWLGALLGAILGVVNILVTIL